MKLPARVQVRGLVAVAHPDLRAFVALCSFAGLRLGEMAALQVGDLDMAARTLTVSRQVQRAGDKEADIPPPKYGSERTVYLADGLANIVRTHLDRLSGEGDTRCLFRGENGNPPHQNTVSYWWRKTRTAAGCPAIKHARPPALLRLGPDRGRVQRRHCPWALGHSIGRAQRTARGPLRPGCRLTSWARLTNY